MTEDRHRQELLNRLNLFEAVVFGLYGGWLISFVDKISFSDKAISSIFLIFTASSWAYQGVSVALSFFTLLLLFGFSMFKPNFMTRSWAFILGFGHSISNYGALWAEGLTIRLFMFWVIGTLLFCIIYAIELRRVRTTKTEAERGRRENLEESSTYMIKSGDSSSMQIFRETVLEAEEPRVISGIDLSTKGCFVKATDKGKANPEWFLDKTVILGYDNQLSTGIGMAECEFTIPKSIGKSVFRADLIIQAFRLQAGLHSSIQHSKAFVDVNEKKIELFMDSRMPYGLDYGFDRSVSIRVENYIKDRPSLKIKLGVQKGVWWDIDEIRLEVTARKSKLRSWIFFVIGIIVSPILDHILNLILGSKLQPLDPLIQLAPAKACALNLENNFTSTPTMGVCRLPLTRCP
jgi:hypothetical protein